jgi:hypothetical protein
MALRERTFRVRCFQRADSWFSRLVRIMTALHEGFWLGFLNADDLSAITAARYGESQYLASTEHNLSGFFSWETPVLERYFRRGSRVLVGAAGAGRELLALHKCGFEADGFECCLPLVRASQETRRIKIRVSFFARQCSSGSGRLRWIDCRLECVYAHSDKGTSDCVPSGFAPARFAALAAISFVFHTRPVFTL